MAQPADTFRSSFVIINNTTNAEGNVVVMFPGFLLGLHRIGAFSSFQDRHVCKWVMDSLTSLVLFPVRPSGLSGVGIHLSREDI